jgi:ribonuclease Z
MFSATLVNDPFGDPGVYVELKYRYAAILFDAGDIHALSPRKILKITHIFISHTHMDHFIGFDHLLRLCLGRDRHIHLFGPPGIQAQVEHKIGAYTWNLVENYANDFTLFVTEIHAGSRRRRKYACRTAFAPEDVPAAGRCDGLLVDDALFTVRGTFLDHRVPCLAYRLEAKTRVNIMKNALTEMGLPVGAWLIDVKDHIARGSDGATLIRAWWRDEGRDIREKYVPLGEIMEKCIKITPGQKISYVTDAVWHEDNIRRIAEVAEGADILFIETPFLHEEEENAARKYHLTARQAGTAARLAGAKRIVLFHFSPKYKGCREVLEREAAAAFRG